MDGRLQSGDQLLSVNGHSLLSVTQEQAAKIMSRCGPIVSFEVAKEAALYNGLARWIYDQSPVFSQENAPSARARLNTSDQVSTPSEYRYSLNSPPLFDQKKSNTSVSALSYTSSPSYYDQRTYSDSMPPRQDQLAAQAAAVAASRTYPVQETSVGASAYSVALPINKNAVGNERSFSTSNLMYEDKHHARGSVDAMQSVYQAGSGGGASVPCVSLPFQRSTYSLPRATPPSGYDERAYATTTQVASDSGHFESPPYYGATPSGSGSGSASTQAKLRDQQHGVRSEVRPAGPRPSVGAGVASISDTDVSAMTTAPYHRDMLQLQSQESRRSPSVQERNCVTGMNLPSYVPSKVASMASSARLPDDEFTTKRLVTATRSTTYSATMTSESPLDKKMETSLVLSDRSSPNLEQSAAVASSGASNAGREDFKSQIETEMEKLLKEELQRLQAKVSLNDAERRRYMVLKYELETRHGVSAYGSDHTGSKRFVPPSLSREETNHSPQLSSSGLTNATRSNPKTNVLYVQHELGSVPDHESPNYSPDNAKAAAARGSSPLTRRQEAPAHGIVLHPDSGRTFTTTAVRNMLTANKKDENDSIGRQMLRDQYYESAERKYQELAAREWHAVHQAETEQQYVRETSSGENVCQPPAWSVPEREAERAISSCPDVKYVVAICRSSSVFDGGYGRTVMRN
ncbi:unnamed protein product [Soboliphyme baturini]|uniref:PDZ domain-containing protein n=1 Tax=Soboliphyme baturini TaxID=241478 RepID=A0A183IWL0_9BILA|nr:unnamed protein product [Soboliphyme baturini]